MEAAVASGWGLRCDAQDAALHSLLGDMESLGFFFRGRFVPIKLHCYKIKWGPKNPKKGTQRAPNFEQKGDPNYVKGDPKGDPKFNFFQNSSQRANMLKQ